MKIFCKPLNDYLGKNYKGPKVSVAALRNEEGELVIIATNNNPHLASTTYKRRWEIESLFGCLKTRGFNFENTHITNLDRINTLLGILAISFTFAYVLGIWRHDIKPIRNKTHGRKAISFFRYGLDYLRRILLLPEKMKPEFNEIMEKFIKPLIKIWPEERTC